MTHIRAILTVFKSNKECCRHSRILHSSDAANGGIFAEQVQILIEDTHCSIWIGGVGGIDTGGSDFEERIGSVAFKPETRVLESTVTSRRSMP